jgi:hypothetical protein
LSDIDIIDVESHAEPSPASRPVFRSGSRAFNRVVRTGRPGVSATDLKLAAMWGAGDGQL